LGSLGCLGLLGYLGLLGCLGSLGYLGLLGCLGSLGFGPFLLLTPQASVLKVVQEIRVKNVLTW